MLGIDAVMTKVTNFDAIGRDKFRGRKRDASVKESYPSWELQRPGPTLFEQGFVHCLAVPIERFQTLQGLMIGIIRP